jgi:hypothetical protein
MYKQELHRICMQIRACYLRTAGDLAHCSHTWIENQQQSLSNKSPPHYKQERQCTHTRKFSNIFHENPPTRSRVVPRGHNDLTKPGVACRNPVNATKMNNNVITLVLTFKTIRHVLGHGLVRVIASYTHTTLNWTLRIWLRKRKRGQKSA